MTLIQAVFIVIAFVSGSLPCAVWIGRFALGRDIRRYGDGNPGAFNAARAGGMKWGAIALILDISKAATPVGLAYQVFGWDGLPLVLVSIAPLLGHAYSPFLDFKGGKAVAATFGVWIGLTLWTVPLVGGIALVIFYRLLDSSGWAVLITLGSMLVALVVISAPASFFIVWLCNLLLVIVKHRQELVRLPQFRSRSHIRNAAL